MLLYDDYKIDTTKHLVIKVNDFLTKQVQHRCSFLKLCKKNNDSNRITASL